MQLAALKKQRCQTIFKDEGTGAHINRPYPLSEDLAAQRHAYCLEA
jgi:hypothetical protein